MTSKKALLAMQAIDLEEYDGMCGEASDQILHAAGRGDVLYVECVQGASLIPSYSPDSTWKFHMVAVVDGDVFDPWSGWPPTELCRYLAKAFELQWVTAALNGDDFFHGPAAGIMKG